MQGFDDLSFTVARCSQMALSCWIPAASPHTHTEVESLSIHEALTPFFMLQTRTDKKGDIEFLVTEKQPVDQQSGADLPFRTFKCIDMAMTYMKERHHDLTGSHLPADKDEQAGWSVSALPSLTAPWLMKGILIRSKPACLARGLSHRRKLKTVRRKAQSLLQEQYMYKCKAPFYLQHTHDSEAVQLLLFVLTAFSSLFIRRHSGSMQHLLVLFAFWGGRS